MKRFLSLCAALILFILPCCAESALTGNTLTICEAVRWNPNLAKTAQVLRAEEFLCKMNKELTLHALLMEVSRSDEQEALYGRFSGVMLIDLDTGDIIDYKNFDGNVMWPDGELTDKHDALHLLYNSYISYIEGWNEGIMIPDHEFVTPLSDEEIAAINSQLSSIFIR